MVDIKRNVAYNYIIKHKEVINIAEWITEAELCEWLKINRNTAWRWRKKGLPYIGGKKSIRYDKNEVEKWLKQKSKE